MIQREWALLPLYGISLEERHVRATTTATLQSWSQRRHTLQDTHRHSGGALEPFFLIFSSSHALIITQIRQATESIWAPKANTIDILYLAISHPTALLCTAEQYVWTEKRGHCRAKRELLSALGLANQPLEADINTAWASENQYGRFRPHLSEPHTHCTSSYLRPIFRASSLTHNNNLAAQHEKYFCKT